MGRHQSGAIGIRFCIHSCGLGLAAGARAATLALSSPASIPAAQRFCTERANRRSYQSSCVLAALILASAPDSPPQVFLRDFRPQSAYSGFILPAGDPSGGNDNILSIVCLVRNVLGATIVSAPFEVEVTWRPELLTDPAAQSSLAEAQSADATALVRTGRADEALAAISAAAVLLNAAPTAVSSRAAALLRGQRTAAANAEPTLEDRERAALRERFLRSVAEIVSIMAVPTATVRRSYHAPFAA